MKLVHAAQFQACFRLPPELHQPILFYVTDITETFRTFSFFLFLPLWCVHTTQIVHNISFLSVSEFLTLPTLPITAAFYLIDTFPLLCPVQFTFIPYRNIHISFISFTYRNGLYVCTRAFQRQAHLCGCFVDVLYSDVFCSQFYIKNIAFKSISTEFTRNQSPKPS